MNGTTILAFEAIAALWSHEPERRLLQQIATSSRWPIACNGGVRRPLAQSSAWRYNVQSARRRHQRRDHKPLRRLLLGGGRVDRTSLQGPAAAEGESHAVAFSTRASTSPAEGVSGSQFCSAFQTGVLSSQVSYWAWT
jgi:hypothetical protein